MRAQPRGGESTAHSPALDIRPNTRCTHPHTRRAPPLLHASPHTALPVLPEPRAGLGSRRAGATRGRPGQGIRLDELLRRQGEAPMGLRRVLELGPCGVREPTQAALRRSPAPFRLLRHPQDLHRLQRGLCLQAIRAGVWYEERRFWVQSQPVACAPCRKARRRRIGALQAYEAKLRVLDKSDPAHWLELAELLDVAGRTAKATEFRNRGRKLLPPALR